mgnify:CR=1 FL=1
MSIPQHQINPFNYYLETTEVIVLKCVGCGKVDKKSLPHQMSDDVIMRRHFKGWEANGYRGQRRTLCPQCGPPKKKGGRRVR